MEAPPPRPESFPPPLRRPLPPGTPSPQGSSPPPEDPALGPWAPPEPSPSSGGGVGVDPVQPRAPSWGAGGEKWDGGGGGGGSSAEVGRGGGIRESICPVDLSRPNAALQPSPRPGPRAAAAAPEGPRPRPEDGTPGLLTGAPVPQGMVARAWPRASPPRKGLSGAFSCQPSCSAVGKGFCEDFSENCNLFPTLPKKGKKDRLDLIIIISIPLLFKKEVLWGGAEFSLNRRFQQLCSFFKTTSGPR